MVGERRSTHPIELARKRQEPESYDDELVPQALDLIRTAAHRDDEVHSAIQDLESGHQSALKNAENAATFKEALLTAFGGDRSVRVIARALDKLDHAISLLSGRQGDSLFETFGGNIEIVSEVHDVRLTAREILQQLSRDIMSETREPLMIAGISE